MNLHAVHGHLMPLALIAVGIASLNGAGCYWKQTDMLLKSAVATMGEVVLKGRQIQCESIVSRYPPRYSAGDKVRILYDPDRPEAARIRSFYYLWFMPSLFSGLGVVMTAVDAGWLIFGVPS